ncbi:MAG: metal-sulfur cluster assembly factor [Dehalococcoidia bacterium]
MIDTTDVLTALFEVYDPEIGLNVVDLGLVYDVDVRDGDVTVQMTMTSPGCPLAPTIEAAARRAIAARPGVRRVAVDLVWQPPWTPDRISAAGRAALGME